MFSDIFICYTVLFVVLDKGIITENISLLLLFICGCCCWFSFLVYVLVFSNCQLSPFPYCFCIFVKTEPYTSACLCPTIRMISYPPLIYFKLLYDLQLKTQNKKSWYYQCSHTTVRIRDSR